MGGQPMLRAPMVYAPSSLGRCQGELAASLADYLEINWVTAATKAVAWEPLKQVTIGACMGMVCECLRREGDKSGEMLAWILRQDQEIPSVLHLCTSVGAFVTTRAAILGDFVQHFKMVYRAGDVGPVEEIQIFPGN
ncbi:hypothetical protein NDU88_010078 [Pleurodeles waltl]|uniref:Uncharacterized protein n=1 Tax=Pleurodeles waltl TaxID=8319 RepID=A0AAV7QTC7_PLEWA|nr:hypothetical protein NDU88_010078 [Pleurodeles waltl]